MRLYPDDPARRTRAVVRDLVLLALLVACALVGRVVHDTVLGLTELSRGVERAGAGIERSFGDAADSVDDAPVVGDDVADGLRGAGERSGGEVAAAGRRGTSEVERLATLLGWLAGGLPALVILVAMLPGRVRQVRRMTEASRVLLPHVHGPERLLVAQRAAFGLPYAALLRHTRDPFGDLATGRLDGLVAAALDDVGLRVPAPR